MKNQWRLIVGVVLILLVVLFAVLNSQSVPVSFGFTKITGPLILIISGSAILGVCIGLLTSISTIWQQKKQMKTLEKKVGNYQKELVEQKKKEFIVEKTTEVDATLDAKDESSIGERVNKF